MKYSRHAICDACWVKRNLGREALRLLPELAAVLAIVTTKLVGYEKAPDIIALAMANALKQTSETRTKLGL